MRITVLLVAALACKSGLDGQSFHDGIQALCVAPEHMDRAYARAHFSNPEVIGLVAVLGGFNPVDRVKKLREAVARAGLASCPFLDAASKAIVEHTPRVQGAGFVEFESEGPLLLASSSGIAVDGMTIVALANGEIDPSEVEGGITGLVIPRLRNFVKALAATRHEAMRLQLLIDPAFTYKLLNHVLFSTKAAGIKDYALVMRVGDAAKAIPFRLPDTPATQVLEPGRGPAPLGLIVAIDGDNLVLWSSSGAEGTQQEPKLTAHGAGEIAEALAEIVDRRWHGGARGELDRQLLVRARGTHSMQRVAEVLAVVRARPDGKDLFPDILLSSGFE